MYFAVLRKNGGIILDKTLERILSLIPRKPDGKFVHGAVKKFAIELGLKSGNIISDWIAGRSKSYGGYLYQISALHSVSVEWLQGKTNDPTPAGQKETPPAQGGERGEKDHRLIQWFRSLPPEKQRAILVSQDAPKDLLD